MQIAKIPKGQRLVPSANARIGANDKFMGSSLRRKKPGPGQAHRQ